MKSIDIKYAKNHCELRAYIESNNFGDQLIAYIQEDKDGSQHEIGNYSNVEGSHDNSKKIKDMGMFFYNRYNNIK